MIRGAVFDIDGTLLDSMPLWNNLGERYLMNCGFCEEETRGLSQRIAAMTVSEGIRYMKAQYGLTMSEEVIREQLQSLISSAYCNEIPLKPGVREFLAVLHSHGIPSVLATAGDPDLAVAALKRLGVWSEFKDLLVCEQYSTSKLEPKIYNIAMERLGCEDPSEVLVFEDVVHAVHTAKSAGFRVCGILDPSEENRDMVAEADVVVRDFFEAMHVFEKEL